MQIKHIPVLLVFAIGVLALIPWGIVLAQTCNNPGGCTLTSISNGPSSTPGATDISTPVCTSGGKGSATTCTCHLTNGAVLSPGQSVTTYSSPYVAFGQSCAYQVRTCDSNGNLSGTANTTQVYSCTVAQPSTCNVNGTIVQHGASQAFYSTTAAPAGQSCSAYVQVRSCYNGTMSGSGSYVYTSCNDTLSCTIGSTVLPSGATQNFYSYTAAPIGQACSSYVQSRTCTNGLASGSASYSNASCTNNASCTIGSTIVPDSASQPFYSYAAAPAGQLCSSYVQTRTCTNGAASGSASYSNAACTNNLSCTLDGATLSNGISRVFYSQTIVPYGQTCSSGTYSLSRTCVNGVYSGNVAYSHANCVAALAPVISSFTILPNIVHLGSKVTASWNATSAQACTLTGTNGDTITSAAPSLSYTTASINDITTYTLTCTGTDGVTKVTAAKQVQIVPSFQEI